MKINKCVRNWHQKLYSLNKRLEEKVKLAFEGKKRTQWFFLCRVKELESFALKLETGRYSTPASMDDFFACTLVVENRGAMAEALTLVSDICEIDHRRPPVEGNTHKSPEEFSFDDLRLYVKLKSDDTLPTSDLDEIIFEVQIKTFLQHAWSIATHDLVYKGQGVHWGRARVAFQIKAMLEHAEVSVERVDHMAESSLLAISDEKSRRLQKIIDWLQNTWEVEWLPKDMVRLASNIISLIDALKVDIDELINCVSTENDQGRGSALHDLTPFAVVVRSLHAHQYAKFSKYLCSEKRKYAIFMGDDLELVEAIRSIPNSRIDKLIVLGDSEK